MQGVNMRHGFTLIELSIVLVIIGLIIGGILVGKDLIKAAELRSFTSDLQKYETAINAFRVKYNCLPGDCTNATQFFGAADAGDGLGADCELANASDTSALTCNGNGDGLIMLTGAPAENYLAWQHLANAELVAGRYSGVSQGTGCGGECGSIIGSNVPFTSIWAVSGTFLPGTVLVDTYSFPEPRSKKQSNFLSLGKIPVGWYTFDSFMFTREALAFDAKIDDGSPTTGRLTAWKQAVACSTDETPAATSATYNTTLDDQVRCAFFYELK